MDEIELLEWQFRIAKMDRAQLESTVEQMADPASKPFSLHDPEAMARLERAVLIHNTEATLNRPVSPDRGAGKSRKKTATVDLHAYYAAIDAEDAEAQDRADRAEVRAMCVRRLVHMDARDDFNYAPAASPLRAYINELYIDKTA